MTRYNWNIFALLLLLQELIIVSADQTLFQTFKVRGDGQVVSVIAFYSDNPSSNPTEAYSFSVQFVLEKNENKQKEAGVGHLKKHN